MSWEIVTGGRSGATVSRRRGVYRKQSGDPADDLVGEGLRLRWLSEQGIPAPEVLECEPGLLVMREVPGREAADGWSERQRPGVVDALAGLARDLHSLSIADCPFDRGLEVTMRLAVVAEPDLTDLDPGRSGWTRDDLVRELVSTRPSDEDLAVCHGDPCLPNVLVDPDSLQVTGVIDTGRLGVADRWCDLAIATRSLSGPRNPQFGAWAAKRYLSTYEIEPDPAKIAFYRLLDEFF